MLLGCRGVVVTLAGIEGTKPGSNPMGATGYIPVVPLERVDYVLSLCRIIFSIKSLMFI